MLPQQDGLFLHSGEQWDEVKSDYDTDPILVDHLEPSRRRPRSVPIYRQILSRITRLFTSLFTTSSALERNLRPTAYLDGLRGFAALLVYFHHHQLWAHGAADLNGYFENGFGYDGKFSWVALPLIRHFFSGGHFAVAVFFVISGYVLSLKPMRLIHARDFGKLSDAVGSAMFRRWPRLYLPIIIVTFVYAMSWHITGIWVRGSAPKADWRDEAWAFYLEFKNFSFVYKEGGLPWLSYHFHLWSIPVEFKGSMVVYATQLALSRCSQKSRLWCEIGLIWYFMFISDGWFCAMFIQGMLLCDPDSLSQKSELPSVLARLGPIKALVFAHLLVIGIYLGGVPSTNAEISQLARNRGWYYLSWLKPQAVFDYKWFYLWIAATCLVVCIPRFLWLKKFFASRFCQFLSRISYALYMVHGPILWTIGDRLYVAAGWFTDEHMEHMEHIAHWADVLHLPRKGPLGLEISFVIPQMILLPLTLLVAEFVTRTVDTPSVNFASWLYRKTLGSGHVSMKQAKA